MNDKPVASPISSNQRIVTLDVLRGFALFGILFVNVTSLVAPANWFFVDCAETQYTAKLFKRF